MSGDTFTRDRLAWLDQIHADHDLGGVALRVAFQLFGFFNRTTGDAWPAVETLAGKCGCSGRAVQMAVEALVKRGHLGVDVSKGRSKTNRYRMILKQPDDAENEKQSSPFEEERVNDTSPFEDENTKPSSPIEAERVKSCSEKGEPQFAKTRTTVHPIPLKKPLSEVVVEKDMSVSDETRPVHEPPPKKARDEYSDSFQTFWKAYPRTKGTSKLDAWKAWRKLSATDQEVAIAALPAFQAWVESQFAGYSPPHACRYLSGRRFEELAAVARETGETSFAVIEGSPEWDAWKTYKEGRLNAYDLRGPDGKPTGQRGCYQPTRCPPEGTHSGRALSTSENLAAAFDALGQRRKITQAETRANLAAALARQRTILEEQFGPDYGFST